MFHPPPGRAASQKALQAHQSIAASGQLALHQELHGQRRTRRRGRSIYIYSSRGSLINFNLSDKHQEEAATLISEFSGLSTAKDQLTIKTPQATSVLAMLIGDPVHSTALSLRGRGPEVGCLSIGSDGSIGALPLSLKSVLGVRETCLPCLRSNAE